MAAYVHPRSTSWGSVLGGWLAALGSLAIFFPVAALGAGFSPAAQARIDDPMLAFPLVLAVFGFVGGILATMIGGWLGGMVAPAPITAVAPAREAAQREPVRREAASE